MSTPFKAITIFQMIFHSGSMIIWSSLLVDTLEYIFAIFFPKNHHHPQPLSVTLLMNLKYQRGATVSERYISCASAIYAVRLG